MGTSSKVRISQCMIVKNEEKNIERALSWGKGVVSEQIVVDTGSTDRTVEIAKRLGAKVYEFQWIDDFAAAKNYAINKAKYEWIAFLDADEYFSVEDSKKLLAYVDQLQNSEFNGIFTALIQLNDQGQVLGVDTQIRVFKNLSELRYRRRIHEFLESSDPKKPLKAIGAVDELSIFHTGYGEAVGKEKKSSGRNLRLIEAELAENPDDYQMWGYLGNEYDGMGKEEKAEDAFRRSIALMPEDLNEFNILASRVYLRLLNLLITSSFHDEASVIDLYKEAIRRRPKEADYDYLIGRYFAEQGRYHEAEEYLRRALELLEQHGNTGKSMLLSGEILKAYEMLAICYFNTGNLAACVQLTTALLKENSYLMSTVVVMLSAFSRDQGSKAEDVAGFLGRSFYNFDTLKDRLFILRAAISAGYSDLVQVMKRTFVPEEMEAVNRALGEVPANSLKKRLKIVLFYSAVESFNFFTDQMAVQLEMRGHEVFILDLRNPPDEDIHSQMYFERFLEEKVDAAICFDALALRTDYFIELWDKHDIAVLDIFMDPPLRFHPAIEKRPRKYHIYCCDEEHVEYVKTYFEDMADDVSFMPHVGVMPKKDAAVIPYEKRKYDILFCGTYYEPEAKFSEIEKICPKESDAYYLYQKVFDNLQKDSSLSIWKAFLRTLDQLGWEVPDEVLKEMLYGCDCIDWAIRMYQRGRVVTVLADAGLELYLLGRGWENHPSVHHANVHRINDRIPYGDTLSYMADAKINLNVMPGFKCGTHDRIFNTLLQRSVPLTDSSSWIDDNFVDGEDIAIFDLDHLEKLPDIVRSLLTDTAKAESLIEHGYKKVSEHFTWPDCVDWLLEAIEKYR